MERGNYPTATNISLNVVPENTKHIFYWIILIITIISMIGNILVIRSIIKRKCKFLQKTCIISLAVADIFSIVLFAVNNLDVLSKPLIVWTLGEFMCYFIPMGQVLGTTASSVALLVIALDRYQNVINAMSKKWDPKPTTCLLICVMLWMVCAVLSYPMYVYFQYEPISILYIGPDSLNHDPVWGTGHLCVAVVKQRLMVYYATMAVLIFLPIMVIFFWFYYKIAALIWKHRKPLSLRFNKFQKKSEQEESSSTKTTELCSAVDKKIKTIVKKEKNVQVERKIRTFKIVVVLMITFIMCRFPYWCFFVLKLVFKFNAEVMWNLNFTFTALNMFNCALNPLLYTFLNQTIRVAKMFNDFVCKICCCCFSNAEFEDFEKDNPFIMENHDPKNELAIYEQIGRNSRVKFADAAHIHTHSHEGSRSSTLQKY